MKHTKRIASLLLVVVMTLSVLAGCGVGKNKDITTVEVNLPAPTDAEVIADVSTSLALNYYMVGRAYIDEFINYDTETLTEANFNEYYNLLAKGIEAIENAGKVNDVLIEAIDGLEKEPEPKEKPNYKVLSNETSFGFGITAHAVAEQGSEKWAREVLDQWSLKTREHGGLRRISEYLGKDTKYAYEALKQAQEILDGKDYQALAKKENAAYQAATVLKTSGTAAGLVIAVATAPVSGTVAAAVSTGGIVMGGVNTVLEVGSTGAILYNNGEDNVVSTFCDNTEAQMAPIGQVFSIASLGSSLKDIGKTGLDALKNGLGSLDEKTKTELAMNSFSVLSYGASSLNDYMNDGSIMSGTLKVTKDGIKFTLKETLTGNEPEKQENIKTVLTEAGLDSQTVDEVIETASKENTAPVRYQTDRIPNDIGDKIIEQNQPEEDDFDIDEYLEKLRDILYEIAEMEYEDEPKPEDSPESAFSIHRVAGTYHISGYDAWDDFEDDEYDESENDSYDLTFTVEGENSLVVSARGSSQSVGNYDPTTGSCGYTDEDGVNVYIQFSESGGVYSVSITYDKTFEDGRSYGSYSGTKK